MLAIPSHRLRPAIVAVAAYLICGLALRVALGANQGIGVAGLSGTAAFGLLNDLAVAAVAAGLVMAAGSLAGRERPGPSWWRIAGLAVVIAAIAFGAAVEWFFFAEFSARFNHIAVDYLLFPGEVAANVWQSYNVPLFAASAAGLGILASWASQHWPGRTDALPVQPPRRWAAAGSGLALAIAGAGLLWIMPAQPFVDRVRNEVAANGVVQLARAFATSHLAYDQYYRELPGPEADRRVAAELGWGDPETPVRTFAPAVARERPLDVVVILEESLGSEFVGRLGGRNAATPRFDRWCDDGLLLTNLVATGNRTVRGLEGVLCSFPPVPGDSVWKLDKSENVASIARVLRDDGYRTEFLYGGAGAFDGMKPFALANGWDRFVEDGLVTSDFPKDAYRTAWGVADEYVFDVLLDHQREARQRGERFFGTVMSTSNHKPFLTPDTRDPRRSVAKLRKWGGIGAILVLIMVGVWLRGADRIGRGRLMVACAVLMLGYGVWLGVKLQPTDSRQHAVRYADRALCDYLDRAKADGLLEHTAVLIVGDHGARVYGSETIPAASYRVPGLFLLPEPRFHGATVDRLCSQVDLAPTLLSLAGVGYRAPFFGQDLMSLPPDAPGRAWLIHNRDIGLLTDQALVVLGLQRSVTAYRRSDRASDVFTQVPVGNLDPDLSGMVDRATAVFQRAYRLYEQRRYVLPGTAVADR
ncbi:MAG: LTA synthase family protein [Planctomycetes bacterium]|nr:LTA synthase family protein [Planctomycetota bacterium]